METAKAAPGANASQDSSEVVETITEEVVEEGRKQRYELDPESESKAESPPAVEDNDDEKTPDGDPRKGVHDRINELTKEWRQTERSAADLVAENEELRRRLSQTGPGPGDTPARDPAIQTDEIPPRKTLADFDYDDAAFMQYMEERTEKIIETRTSKAFHDQQRKAAEQARALEHQSREREFAAQTEDYWPSVQQVPVTTEMLEIVQSSEVGPDLLYYLGKNQPVAQGLVQVSPIEMARRLTMIETEIKAARKEASQPKVSSAPPPAKKVKATDPGVRVNPSDPASDKLSDAEWFKRRHKEVEASRKR